MVWGKLLRVDTTRIILPSGHVTLIDSVDYARVVSHSWWINKSGYVWRALKKDEGTGFLLLHRYLMNADQELDVHHNNENKLDNRKANLTLITTSEHGFKHNIRRYPTLPKNCDYKGVHFEASRGRWKAMIWPQGKAIFLGRFSSPEEAALAYNRAALQHFGAEAYMNEVSR